MSKKKHSLKTIQVSSWKELMDALSSKEIFDKSNETGYHIRSPYVFRGMEDASWDLETSLQRLEITGTPRRNIEASLIRNFRKYANAGGFDDKSEWYILAVAQHNGLPTRVLDWTTSPLVATHFACSDKRHMNSDGVIWCLNAGTLRNLNSPSLQGKSWVYDTRILEEEFRDLKFLDSTRKKGPLMLLWEPPSLDARIANQSGLLSILNSCDETQDEILASYQKHTPEVLTRIIIAAKAKPEIRDMLDQNGITERTMFPGLPGLCDWLKRYYAKSWSTASS